MQMSALQFVVAQDTIPIVNNIEESDTVVIGTQPQLRRQNTATVIDVTDNSPTQINSIVRLKGDPMKASMMSAVFPGGGQILNRKYWYWKLPAVYAGFGAVFYMYKINSDNYQMYYKGYLDITDDTRGSKSYLNFITDYNPANDGWYKEQILRRIDYHKRNRDLSMILAGVWYFAQILWANVDASLLDYDVSDNLELSLSPKMLNMQGALPFAGVNLSFKINF